MIALILGTPFAYPIPCGRERVTSTLGFIDRILLGCPEFHRYGVSRRGKKTGPISFRSFQITSTWILRRASQKRSVRSTLSEPRHSSYTRKPATGTASVLALKVATLSRS